MLAENVPLTAMVPLSRISPKLIMSVVNPDSNISLGSDPAKNEIVPAGQPGHAHTTDRVLPQIDDVHSHPLSKRRWLRFLILFKIRTAWAKP